MRCPRCEQHASVAESRAREDYVYRRRECDACRYRFTTTEHVVPDRAHRAPERRPTVRLYVGPDRVY